MKRWSILLLTLAMLFAFASAEEVFEEESFLDAGVQGEEFFSEESFFGDAFEAEAPEEGAETDAEDRSVFLFQTETGKTRDLDWQKYYVKAEGAATGKVIELKWSLFTDEACTVQAPSITPGKGTYAGVKFYVYQVDPWTGVAKEVATSTGFTAKVSVKNPGDYYYFVRLEKVSVDKAHKTHKTEYLGIASQRVKVTVDATDKDFEITSLKLYKGEEKPYVERDHLSDAAEISYMFTPYVDLYTPKAADAYIITAQMKGHDLCTGYYLVYDSDKEKVFAGYPLRIYLDYVRWDFKKGEMPAFLCPVKGTKLKVTAAPAGIKPIEDGKNSYEIEAIGKVKKANLKVTAPKWNKITEKTPPEVSAKQVGANSLCVTWTDNAARYDKTKPTSYIVTYGKQKVEFPVNTLAPTGKGIYKVTLTDVNGVSKAKKLKVTVQAKVENKKLKNSKPAMVNFLPASELAIFNATHGMGTDPITIYWMGDNDAVATYQVYLTDNEHNIDVAADTAISAAKDASNPNWIEADGMFFARFYASKFQALTDGRRLGIVIKAIANDGDTVLGRMTFIYDPNSDESNEWYLPNANYLETATVELIDKAQYTGYYQLPIDLIDEDGDEGYYNYLNVSKIVYTDLDGNKKTWDNDPETADIPDVPNRYYQVIQEPGTYVITAEVKDSTKFKDIAEFTHTFTIEKSTLTVELADLDYSFTDNYLLIDEIFIQRFIRIVNGDQIEVNLDSFIDGDIRVLKEDGAQVPSYDGWETPILEAGNYQLELSLVVSSDNTVTDGLIATEDPNLFILRVTLPFKVTDKKQLYLQSYYSDELQEYYGWVGNFESPNFVAVDWQGYPVKDAIYTTTVLDEDSNPIKEGDMAMTVGSYVVTLTATKEGWEPASMSYKVTIFANEEAMLQRIRKKFPFGRLKIQFEGNQYLDHDGTPKLPVFKVLDEDNREITAGYQIEIYKNVEGDWRRVDQAIDIGEYHLRIKPDEPWFDASPSEFVTFYIMRGWTLEQKVDSIMETNESLASGTKLAKLLTAKIDGAEIPSIFDVTPEPYPPYAYYCEIVYDSIRKDGEKVTEIREAGTYTFKIKARVLVYGDEYSGYYPGDFSPREMEISLTITSKWTMEVAETSKTLMENGDNFANPDSITFKAYGTDKDGNEVKDIPKYDATEAPDGWKFDRIGEVQIYHNGAWGYTSSISMPGKYKFKVWATWDGVYKSHECELEVTDAWAVRLVKNEILANGENLFNKDLFKAYDLTADPETEIDTEDWYIDGYSYYVQKYGIWDGPYSGDIINAGTYKLNVYARAKIGSVTLAKEFEFTDLKVVDTWTVDLDSKKLSLELPAIGTDIFKEFQFSVKTKDGTAIQPKGDGDTPPDLYYEIDDWYIYEKYGDDLITSINYAENEDYTLREPGTYLLVVKISLGGNVPEELYEKDYCEILFAVSIKPKAETP